MVQLRHPEKTLAIFPGLRDLTPEDHARLFGLGAAAYGQTLEDFTARVRGVARELPADPEFAALPLEPGQTILGLGDSLTADRQSWFEVLRQVLELRRLNDRLRLINAGVSADTTVHLLTRLAPLTVHNPAWILTLIGTNDVRLHGKHSTKRRAQEQRHSQQGGVSRHDGQSRRRPLALRGRGAGPAVLPAPAPGARRNLGFSASRRALERAVLTLFPSPARQIQAQAVQTALDAVGVVG
ncbi:SGNH/GDSL hydrolase family protein [Deinococcus aetherius]|nr:GDSL-type esterase/lipase family protein [Deinococcus aetherius]